MGEKINQDSGQKNRGGKLRGLLGLVGELEDFVRLQKDVNGGNAEMEEGQEESEEEEEIDQK